MTLRRACTSQTMLTVSASPSSTNAPQCTTTPRPSASSSYHAPVSARHSNAHDFPYSLRDHVLLLHRLPVLHYPHRALLPHFPHFLRHVLRLHLPVRRHCVHRVTTPRRRRPAWAWQAAPRARTGAVRESRLCGAESLAIVQDGQHLSPVGAWRRCRLRTLTLRSSITFQPSICPSSIPVRSLRSRRAALRRVAESRSNTDGSRRYASSSSVCAVFSLRRVDGCCQRRLLFSSSSVPALPAR